MNIHEAVLQPIAAFVYCNRQASYFFQNSYFLTEVWFTESMRVIMQNFMATAQTDTDFGDYSIFFSKWRPSAT